MFFVGVYGFSCRHGCDSCVSCITWDSIAVISERIHDTVSSYHYFGYIWYPLIHIVWRKALTTSVDFAFMSHLDVWSCDISCDPNHISFFIDIPSTHLGITCVFIQFGLKSLDILIIEGFRSEFLYLSSSMLWYTAVEIKTFNIFKTFEFSLFLSFDPCLDGPQLYWD